MNHLDEEILLTVRDGGPVGAAVLTHLEVCGSCNAALEAAHQRAEAIAQTLTMLDGPIEATAAKAGVRGRLRHGASGRGSAGWARLPLGRAAALLLLTAGAAAALPWSPVWSLLQSVPEATPGPMPTQVSVGTTTASAQADTSPAGISVAVPDGLVQVVVRGAAPGSEISVTWSDQATARLNAAAGSRFTYAAGRIEVDASRGAVSMELPRNAVRVSLEVDGRLYLTGSPDALEVLGPGMERTGESIRFRVGER